MGTARLRAGGRCACTLVLLAGFAPAAAAGGRPAVDFREGDFKGALRACPGGKVQLRVSTSGSARLHDAATGKPIGGELCPDRRGCGATMRVTSWAFSPDGKLVAVAAGDKQPGPISGSPTSVGDIRVWDTATGKLVASLPGAVGWVRGVAFAADGRTVLYRADKHEVDGK
jgi:WD40 repeat protein